MWIEVNPYYLGGSFRYQLHRQVCSKLLFIFYFRTLPLSCAAPPPPPPGRRAQSTSCTPVNASRSPRDQSPMLEKPVQRATMNDTDLMNPWYFKVGRKDAERSLQQCILKCTFDFKLSVDGIFYQALKELSWFGQLNTEPKIIATQWASYSTDAFFISRCARNRTEDGLLDLKRSTKRYLTWESISRIHCFKLLKF